MQLRIWTDQLTDNTWIIGGWIRRKAAGQIATAALEGSALAVHVLATVGIRSADAAVSDTAWKSLRKCSSPTTLDAIWQVWSVDRPTDLFDILRERNQAATAPGDLRVLSLLKLGDLQPLERCTPSMMQPLFNACYDSDEKIQHNARTSLGLIKNQSAINALCAHWVENRDPLLGEAVARFGYVAKSPRPVWLLSSLKNRRDVLAALTTDDIPVLDKACAGPDTSLAETAKSVLERLNGPTLQSALCELFIEEGSENAGGIAQRQGFLPAAVEDRALFYFLTGQTAKYLEIDFDQRILQAAYQGATTSGPADPAPAAQLRQRILRQLQAVGRVDLLRIISGEGYRPAGEMTPAEVNVLIETLTRGREWPRLWKLAFEVPYRDSLGILHSLAQADWQPAQDSDRGIWAQLRVLLGLSGSADPRGRELVLPPAVALARIKTTGRINSIAFAPASTEIALGTGDRRVFIWDFQTAQIKKQPVQARHSVGKLAFAGSDALIWCEKSNTTAECAVQLWKNQTVEAIGSHRGSITGLSVTNGLAFTSGRDGDLSCWNWRTGQHLSSQKFPVWPRALCVHPTEQRMALLHGALVMVSLPDLKVLYDSGRAAGRQGGQVPLNDVETGMTSAACFAGPDHQLVVGRHNGQTLKYLDAGRSYRAEGLPAISSGLSIRGLAYSTPYQTLIVGAGNEIRFFKWPDCAPAGQMSTGSANLAATEISPSGEFLAVGKVDGSAELWDLRVLGLPDLFQKPLSNGTPNDLAALQALRTRRPGEVERPAQFRVDLDMIYLLLFKRLMHDIQLGEAPHIQPGDFDIILSG